MSVDISFLTGVRFYKGVLEQLNHITYIYDVNWSPNNSTKATFPVSFFSIKSMHEVMATEVNQKQMLFYNSQLDNSESDPMVNSGLLNVVSDNIVIKPKTYKLDILLPFESISLLNQSFIFNTETMEAINTALITKSGKASKILSPASAWLTASQPIMKFLKTLIKSLILSTSLNVGGEGSSLVNITEYINNVLNQPEYNKNSLETMWQMRRILKLKTWNSWAYKFVVITDLDISKEGTEDGVYNATMTLQEVPIATTRNATALGIQPYVNKNTLIKEQGDKAITILDTAGKLGNV